LISLERVCFNYGEEPLFKNLNVEFQPYKIYGIIGPDGAGKTTFLRLLMGILTPLEGEIKKRDGMVSGYVSEQFGMYPDLNLYENLMFFGRLYGLSEQECVKRSNQLLKWAKMDQFKERLAGHLSGGMKRKLALLKAIIHQPDCLILDELTFGVDPLFRKEIWELIRNIHRQGTTVFVSTPYLEDAEQCDEVLFFYQGDCLVQSAPMKLLDEFPYDILLIPDADWCKVQDLRELRKMPGVVDAYFHGLDLRILCFEQERLIKTLKKWKETEWIEMRIEMAAPSYEDVFIEKMKEGVEEE
jgi:ABC-2 type transport system ATP-binding protein